MNFNFQSKIFLFKILVIILGFYMFIRFFSAIVVFVSAVNPVFANSEYRALVSCKHMGSYMLLESCFSDTDLKVTVNGLTKLYKSYDIRSAGTSYGNGLEIKLPSSFSITAQNSASDLVLSIIIKNSSNDVVFSDEVGKFGVIKVRN